MTARVIVVTANAWDSARRLRKVEAKRPGDLIIERSAAGISREWEAAARQRHIVDVAEYQEGVRQRRLPTASP